MVSGAEPRHTLQHTQRAGQVNIHTHCSRGTCLQQGVWWHPHHQGPGSTCSLSLQHHSLLSVNGPPLGPWVDWPSHHWRIPTLNDIPGHVASRMCLGITTSPDGAIVFNTAACTFPFNYCSFHPPPATRFQWLSKLKRPSAMHASNTHQVHCSPQYSTPDTQK